MLESIKKIKSLTTEQLQQVKMALEKIVKDSAYHTDQDAYKAAWVLVVLEIENRK
jgi:hypothetical protein